MAIESVPYVVSDFTFKPWYLLLDYRIWALLIFIICILLRFKKTKIKKSTTLIMVQDVIITLWMLFNGNFAYIKYSSLGDIREPYYSLGDAIFGCLVLVIGIFVLSVFYLIIETIVNYKKQ